MSPKDRRGSNTHSICDRSSEEMRKIRKKNENERVRREKNENKRF